MIEGEPSRTADRVALERAVHQLIDTPLVLADPLAIRMLPPEDAERLSEHPDRHDASPVARPIRATVVARSRIAEDELSRATAAGVTQYVLLGAGLDTFAYRNPHQGVRVFEVDQPSTQQLKRERLTAAGIAIPETMTFVPFDFRAQTLPAVLDAAGFDRQKPAVFAWLGVVMYLDRIIVRDTLRFVASLPAGTAVVFDYALPPAEVHWLVRFFYRQALKMFANQGEPWICFFTPVSLRLLLDEVGFREIDDLGAGELNRRFFANRHDGLKAYQVVRIAVVRR